MRAYVLGLPGRRAVTPEQRAELMRRVDVYLAACAEHGIDRAAEDEPEPAAA